ncbi:MAG: choice-of-anchor tandem repeat GloVer-containing protein [Rhizomicrobium sp.]
MLHGFDYHVDGNAPSSDLLLKGGVLFGTTFSGGPTSDGDGTIFSMDPGTGATTTLYSFTDGTDGIFPSGGLAAGPNSSLYGVAQQGTSSGAGAIFALKTKTNKFTALYDFTGGADGGIPRAGLVAGSGVSSTGQQLLIMAQSSR